MYKLDKNVVEELRGPIWSVWSEIAPDALDFVEDDYQAMEMVLDADRLGMFGQPHAQSVVDQLFKEYGFVRVCKYLSAEMKLYYNS